jgi:hypothetical protein
MKKELFEKIVGSLMNEPDKWEFKETKATNSEWGIVLWIGMGILFYQLYSPICIKLSLFQKVAIFEPLRQCKSKYVLRLKK